MISWFRSWHGAPGDTKLAMVAVESRQPRAIVTAIWWEFLDYASQNEERGSLTNINFKVIAFRQGINEAQCLAVKLAMRELDMLTDNNNIVGWAKRQPKREDNSQERVQQFREKQSLTKKSNAMKRNVTQCNAPDTDTDTESKIDPIGSVSADALSPPKKPDFIHRVQEVWNRVCGELLPKINILSEQRRKTIKLRLAEFFEDSVEKWEEYCLKIRGSPMLVGDNDRGWRASFDWALKPANIAKILEGNYDQQARKIYGNGQPQQSKFEQGLAGIAASRAKRYAARPG